MPTSVLATLARPLWRLAEDQNLDATSIFRESGLDPDRLRELRGHYPYDHVSSAWLKVAAITNNPHIGLNVAKYYRPLDLHALGVAFLSSNTLLQALKRIERYESVLNSSLNFSVIEKPGSIDLMCEGLPLDEQALIIAEDSRSSVILDLCRIGIGGPLAPMEIAFTYPQPMNTEAHDNILRCPITFSAPKYRISFSVSDSERLFTAANRDLARGNDQILDKMLKELEKSDLVSKVKQAIVEHLPSGTPSEETIAQSVLTSTRTLNRRLVKEGTNFRTLLTEVRRELAEQYISDIDIPITEISFLLGFSDISSFSRAFKRWTGRPPQSFRETLSQ